MLLTELKSWTARPSTMSDEYGVDRGETNSLEFTKDVEDAVREVINTCSCERESEAKIREFERIVMDSGDIQLRLNLVFDDGTEDSVVLQNFEDPDILTDEVVDTLNKTFVDRNLIF